MGYQLAFGSYMAGSSPVHRMKTQAKIVLACVFCIGIFFVGSWAGMGIATVAMVASYAVARVNPVKAAAGLKPVVFILLFTIIAHCIPLSVEGLLTGLKVALRIALVVCACCLLTFTTSNTQLTAGLATLLSPLRVLRVPVDDVCTVISMALRFVPVTAAEAHRIMDAQRARCADFDSGNIIKRFCLWVSILVPLVVRLFKRSDELACALDARAYGTGKRTPAKAVPFGVSDGAVMIVGIAAIIALGIIG